MFTFFKKSPLTKLEPLLKTFNTMAQVNAQLDTFIANNALTEDLSLHISRQEDLNDTLITEYQDTNLDIGKDHADLYMSIVALKIGKSGGTRDYKKCVYKNADNTLVVQRIDSTFYGKSTKCLTRYEVLDFKKKKRLSINGVDTHHTEFLTPLRKNDRVKFLQAFNI